MKRLLYGAAYYDEYMPYDRLDKDIEMMKAASINVVRIAESTWSTLEPQNGVFDFSHIDRVLDAMEANNIYVIVGTPTYAIPAWMVKSHPEVIATTKKGKGMYGARQNMDITHPVYLFYAERIIRMLISHVANRKCVIGYQIDNETKHYDTASYNVQLGFVKYLRDLFHDDLKAMNYEFGLDYWSNRIDSWECFPDIRGTINASLAAEFSKYQRGLVDHFLQWQSDLVNEYKREDQFITHNFDFEWRNYSYGVQPSVNHFHASKALTISGCDIYHPTQDSLTGEEIAFGGDLTRSTKQDNYLVLETQAQGHLSWLPYKGQLRLQAFSHLASGANSVMYWHWHSIHNSLETYWKGLLSHDFAENDTYLEAKIIGAEMQKLSSKLVNLKKNNQAAILVSNEALTALEWFKIGSGMINGPSLNYNDIVRLFYNQLYRLNIECDFISPETQDLNKYKMIVVPALYSAPEDLLHKLNKYVYNGGNLITTFRTAIANEFVKVYHDKQPHIIHECLGLNYNQFTSADNVYITKGNYDVTKEDCKIHTFMDLIKPTTATIMASYDHYNWAGYAAITQNSFGNGLATYIGCIVSENYLKEIIKDCLKKAGLFTTAYEQSFPLIVRKGMNDENHLITYFFNYSMEENKFSYKGKDGIELISEKAIRSNEMVTLKPWDFMIIESET